MRFSTKTIALSAVLALSAVPAFALPSQVPDNQGTQHAPSSPGKPADPGSQGKGHAAAAPSSGASATNTPKGRAYGKLCATQSKKHVAGQRGTPFSKCVTAMAKLASGQTRSPAIACKSESKKHVAGVRGTPFSKCVSAAAKLLKTLEPEQPAS